MRVNHIAKNAGVSPEELRGLVLSGFDESPKKVLLIPPDITRVHSRAGEITAILYKQYASYGAEVDVLPALGTHVPMTPAEAEVMFGGAIPFGKIIEHRWRDDVVTLGHVPGAFVKEVSDGLLDFDIEVQLNSRIVNGGYDLIVCAGQVVPHEVAGLASYSKHLFVGCGGSQMINRTHFVGAVYGAERIMGRADTPVRKIWDYAAAHFAAQLPVRYALTVIGKHEGKNVIKGLFIGDGRDVFEAAGKLAQELNIDYVPREVKTCVVTLDPEEYRTTWLGNKAVYRTRMMLADGARLIVLAPGLTRFGEDLENDALIRKYGYFGRERTLSDARENADLAENLSVAAHLVHGTSDGRFDIVYCANPAMKKDIESVGYSFMDIAEAQAKYAGLSDGYNATSDGEIYYISNPALGLWATRERFGA